MRFASAMKYGGELVDAADCDYASFKSLFPLCPCCKEPVFLRGASWSTSVKGRRYQLSQHWSHFKGVSPEQASLCDQRVGALSEKEVGHFYAVARGQRLQVLHKRFRAMVTPYLPSKPQKSLARKMRRPAAVAAKYFVQECLSNNGLPLPCTSPSNAEKELADAGLPWFFWMRTPIQADISPWFMDAQDQISRHLRTDLIGVEEGILPESLYCDLRVALDDACFGRAEILVPIANYWQECIHPKQHERICAEVFSFLIAPSSRRLLEWIFLELLDRCEAPRLAYRLDKQGIGNGFFKFELSKWPEHPQSALVMLIGSIPWEKEFAEALDLAA